MLAGGTNHHVYLAGQNLKSVSVHQLLLQTVNGAESYPPFALLPLLRVAKTQSGATFWPANHLPCRRYHVKPPCFAACPLYAKAQPQPSLNLPVKLHTTPKIKIGVTSKTELPSHPVCVCVCVLLVCISSARTPCSCIILTLGFTICIFRLLFRSC